MFAACLLVHQKYCVLVSIVEAWSLITATCLFTFFVSFRNLFKWRVLIRFVSASLFNKCHSHYLIVNRNLSKVDTICVINDGCWCQVSLLFFVISFFIFNIKMFGVRSTLLFFWQLSLTDIVIEYKFVLFLIMDFRRIFIDLWPLLRNSLFKTQLFDRLITTVDEWQ